ncbi:MAG: B12-binding domain-containing protein [Rubrimonas sp.]|uniref:cobalamin B12-binding domain-containing protein n=1 Tax=Rubrimonas sp. TaxID=2036015 RepID=UPI002FDCA4E9
MDVSRTAAAMRDRDSDAESARGFGALGLDPCAPNRRDPGQDSLRALVESAVIPMLLQRCRQPEAPRRAPPPSAVDALARGALARDGAAASALVASLYSEGVDVESLLNDLIAPAAVRLGEYWHADAADFVEIALASQRLLAITRALGEQLEHLHPAPVGAPLAIVGSPANERHAMGALIVANSFRAAGWRVREAPGAEAAELAEAVRAEHVALVGLSVCSERALAALPQTVALLRRASRNRRLIVTMGGAALSPNPALGEGAGADFVARDARDAVARAKSCLSHSG